MPLYVDTLSQYTNSLVTVISGRSGDSGVTGKGTIGSISGILIEEQLALNGSASLGPADANDIETLKRSGGKLAGLGNNYIGSKIDKHFSSLVATAELWREGSKFSFSISFNVFKTSKRGVGTVTSYKGLMEYLSKLTHSKSGVTDTKKLPHYYDLIEFEKAIAKNDTKKLKANLFTVTIGKWFKSTLLMPTSVTANFSTHTDKLGSPIFCTVTMAFQTFRELTSKEYSSIITK